MSSRIRFKINLSGGNGKPMHIHMTLKSQRFKNLTYRKVSVILAVNRQILF